MSGCRGEGWCGRVDVPLGLARPSVRQAKVVSVSARIYALSALDQVDLAPPKTSYPECHVPLVAMAMAK